MEYKIEIKPFIKKDGMKYKVIQLTDIKLHTTTMKPSSIGKNIKKSLQTGEPGRIYNHLSKQWCKDNYRLVILDIVKNDPIFLETIQDYEKDGYKILIEIPKEGLPVYFGEDTKEFLTSKNGKRLIRGFEKEKKI